VESARALDTSDIKAVDAFKKQVMAEAEQTLAALGGLEDEVKELQESQGNVREAELSLHELEDRFKEHFKELHEGETA
jgi:hypothetical protein